MSRIVRQNRKRKPRPAPLTHAQHWERVAGEIAAENEQLRATLSEVRQAKTLGDVRGILNRVGVKGGI